MDDLQPEPSAGAPAVVEPPTEVEETLEEARASRPRWRRWVLPAVLVPTVLAVLVTAAWAIDTGLGGVPRNVRLAHTDIGGHSEDELRTRVRSVAEGFASTPVEVVSGSATYRTTAGEIGVTVDEDRTVEQALDVGATGFVLFRPLGWLTSFVTPREADIAVQVSREQVNTKIVELEGDARTPPREPAVELVDGALHVVPGKDGRGIDARDLEAALEEAASQWAPGATLRIQVPRGAVPPLGSTAEARAAASAAEALVDDSIEITTEAGDRTLSSDLLRSWVSLKSNPDGTVGAILDPDKTSAGLRAEFEDVDGHPEDATITVVGGVPIIRPGKPGRVCCGGTAPQAIEDALREGRATVALKLVEGPPTFTADDAGELGITQPVGGNHAWRSGQATTGPAGFTTYHDAGGARVTNIHRIADLVRGAILRPGETFSVNDHVGKRTAENGFVTAGAIRNKEHVDELGGGISQFATTAFNAAFFAGLDIDEYQAHSEYFNRYPLGREATMGFPAPDLRFTNNTPYGILIWTSYTSTSLTVTLYSTPWATAEQTAISEGMAGACRTVTTTRTRTYPDGTTEVDKFRARYRPGEGLSC